MNSWQEWVVALLIVLCIVKMVRGLFSFFHRMRSDKDPCAGCAGGCELKQRYEARRMQCLKDRKPSRKKCCCG